MNKECWEENARDFTFWIEKRKVDTWISVPV